MKTQRWTKTFPCLVCGGHPDMPKGRGIRCAGFLSACGGFARCTRENHAGVLPADTRTTPTTYAHWLEGPCRCGRRHDRCAVPIPPKAALSKAAIWTPITPVPDWAPQADFPEWYGRPVSHVWTYRDQRGRVIYHRARFDKPGGKDVIPRSFCQGPGAAQGWRWRDLLTKRPLYGLELLDQRPDAAVLLTEGEKAADAGRLHFPDHLVLAWPNGANGVPYVDWMPLAGRHVILWPDADESGVAAARRAASLILGAGAKGVRVVKLPPGLPCGWDLADHIVEKVPV